MDHPNDQPLCLVDWISGACIHEKRLRRLMYFWSSNFLDDFPTIPDSNKIALKTIEHSLKLTPSLSLEKVFCLLVPQGRDHLTGVIFRGELALSFREVLGCENAPHTGCCLVANEGLYIEIRRFTLYM